MARDLPPLNAVRMFEVAARYRNFTRAADVLHVTQGAVSRQIKHLESHLQQQLFTRDGPRIELTAAGEHLYQAATKSLAILRRGTLELARMSAAPTLTISVLPSFATNWMVQRIPDFQRAHPNIGLRLAASYEAIDFRAHPDIDLAIRFGGGGWHDVYSEHIFREEVFPVCTPEFLERNDAIAHPSRLASLPLLYVDDEYDQWDEWFEAASVDPPRRNRSARYSDISMLIRAAIEGQGVALARSLMFEAELRSKRLLPLFDISIPSRFSYYFVCPDGRQHADTVGTFLNWLKREAAKSGSP